MLASRPVFQALLDAIGWVLAGIYDVIPNYGVSIIILTLVIRVLLLARSASSRSSRCRRMQAIQPKIKELQKKYKGNKQKAQEETMKLYKEAGVNPLGGCLPLLLQFPILIAMYAVIRAPVPRAGPRSRAGDERTSGHEQPPARPTARCSRTSSRTRTPG